MPTLTKRARSEKTWLMIIIGFSALANFGAAEMTDPRPEDYFRCRQLILPIREDVRFFYPKDKKANFTFFSGIKDFMAEAETIKFTLTEKRAVLGWGNYMGKQPLADIVDMWPQKNDVELRIRQSGRESKWTLYPWANGKRIRDHLYGIKVSAEATLKGDAWNVLKFNTPGYQVPTPDGLEFVIEGQPGERFEIGFLKLLHPEYRGYCRKEFTLPEGKIWRAVADVGGIQDGVYFLRCAVKSVLYINGEKIERKSANHINHTVSIDIAPYLKPGKNCVGFYFYGVPPIDPFVFFQANVVFESGEVVTCQTDNGWKYRETEEKGWNAANFNDAAWTRLSARADLNYWTSRAGGFRELSIPDYSGRLKIANPFKKDLYYSDAARVCFDISTPSGYKRKNPVVEYDIGKANSDGESVSIKRGELTDFHETDSGLTARLDAGKFPGGVYTLSLTLKRDNEVLERRPRAPFVVIRGPTRTRIAGENYSNGLDLELEDVIDFTDAADSHPWIEVQHPAEPRQPAEAVERPRIIRKDGMVYREGAPNRSSYFSYRLNPFKNPGDFYLMELEYPDNAQRDFIVSIASKVKGHGANCQAGVGVATGGAYFRSNDMLKLYWIHVADHGVHSIDIGNCDATYGSRAAAKSLKIYRVKGELPSINVQGERRFGVFCETCFFDSGHGMNFGLDAPVSPEEYEKTQKLPMLQRFVKDLVWMWNTADKYARYLKFSGQNAHVLSAYQYTEFDRKTPVPYQTDTARTRNCLKRMMANTFSVNNISFYLSIEFLAFWNAASFVNNAQVARGADTTWPVDRFGKQANLYDCDFHRFPSCMNWRHPKVKEQFKGLMEELATEFDLPGMKGAQLLIGPPDLFNPMDAERVPERYLCDDCSFEKFVGDMNIEVAWRRDDPDRFRRRHEALKNNAALAEKYRDWRCRQAQSLLMDLLASLRGKGKDVTLNCVLGCLNPVYLRDWLSSGRTFGDYYKDFAIDFDFFKRAERICLAPTLTSWTNYGGNINHRDPRSWICSQDKGIAESFTRTGDSRYVFVTTSQDENSIASPGYRVKGCAGGTLVKSDWILDTYKIRANPQPSMENARKAFVEALVMYDPDVLIFGFTDVNLPIGHERELREFAKTFVALPKEKFKPALGTGIETNIVLRELRGKGATWFYSVNPGYWPIEVELTLKADGRIENIATKTPALETPTTEGGTASPRRLRIALPPYGLVAYKINSDQVEFLSYAILPIEKKYVDHMSGYLVKIARLLDVPEYGGALNAAERELVDKTLSDAAAAIVAREYALAWSLVSGWRFRIACGKIERMVAESAIGPNIDQGWKFSRPVEDKRVSLDVPRVKLSDDMGWRPIESDDVNTGRININPILGNRNAVVYFANTVTVNEERPFLLEFGHDGGARLFVDGKPMICSPGYFSSISALRDKAPITLSKGDHEILIAIDLRQGWGFRLRFSEPNGKSVPLSKYPRHKK